MAATEQPRHPALPPKQTPGGKRTPSAQALAAAAPWLPVDYELSDVTALQALARGDADPDQQRRALKWIINSAAATYDFPFRPGADDRDTNVALGRQFVGQQIVKLLNLNPAAMRRREPNADLPEG